MAPAGVPPVELGDELSRQLESCDGLLPIAALTLPPVPRPRESPATRRIVVPARTLGVHANPVVLSGALPGLTTSMGDVCPPGIRSRKFTTLHLMKNMAVKLGKTLHPPLIILIPSKSSCLTLVDNIVWNNLKDKRGWCGSDQTRTVAGG